MNRVFIFLMVMSHTGLLGAHSGLGNIKKDNIQIKDTFAVVADNNHCAVESYNTVQNDVDDLEEYEQQICDNVTPPKISTMQAYLTSIAGAILIRMIIMREITQKYFAVVKQSIGHWLGWDH